ncbi:MAG: hypothetical protein U0U69_16415 [Acidimicrobiia bacterium]
MKTDWPPEPAGRSVWSDGSRRRVASILCAIVPPEDVGADDALVPRFVGAFGATLPPLTRLGLLLGCTLLYFGGPLVFLGRAAAFDAIGIDEREEMLRRIVYSRWYLLRLLGTMLRSLAGLGVLGDPGARVVLGVDPPVPPLAPSRPVRWDADIRAPGVHE